MCWPGHWTELGYEASLAPGKSAAAAELSGVEALVDAICTAATGGASASVDCKRSREKLTFEGTDKVGKKLRTRNWSHVERVAAWGVEDVVDDTCGWLTGRSRSKKLRSERARPKWYRSSLRNRNGSQMVSETLSATTSEFDLVFCQ